MLDTDAKLLMTLIAVTLDDRAPSVDEAVEVDFCVTVPAVDSDSELDAVAVRCCVPVTLEASAPRVDEPAADRLCVALIDEASAPRTGDATALDACVA